MALYSDTVEFAMSLRSTLAAKDIAEATGMSPCESLARLLASDAGGQLFDDSIKLW